MNTSKNGHKKLRASVAKHLKVSEDSDPFDFVWECLDEDRDVKEWDQGLASEEELFVAADRLLRRYRRARKGRSPQSEGKRQGGVVRHVPVEPTEREREMTNALRKYFAAHAARRPLVQRFRREHLPDGLLTRDEEISEFLAEELEVEPDLERYLASRRGKRSDVLSFKLAAEPPPPDRSGPPFVVTNEGLAEIFAEEERRQAKQLEEDWEGGPTWWHLEELGEWLADKYPWENVGDAEVFLISGRPPQLAEPLSAAMDMGNSTYSITFWPWVSKEAILRAHREIQQGHHAGQPTHRRSPGDKRIRVLRFVTEYSDEEGGLPSWGELYDRWNASNPNERFSDRSALHKAYTSAVKALVPPYLPLT